MLCFFATDLHGKVERYRALFRAIERERPEAVLLGGDLLPSFFGLGQDLELADFLGGFLQRELSTLRGTLGDRYPRICAILGNDDARAEQSSLEELTAEGLLEHAHGRRIQLGEFPLYGYSYVPPTPFSLKDWERYDVSRFVDPGCVSPEEGQRSVPVGELEATWSTIAADLEALVEHEPALRKTIMLFHAPPYQTALDRADLDGQMIDHVPLDVHVGSVAIRRFIEAREPLVTLHGHVHEAARRSERWRDRLGRTHILGGAHDGDELALVRFDPTDLRLATRELIG